MSVQRGKRFAGSGEPLIFPSVQPVQIAVAADPRQPTASLFADEPATADYIGRPLNIWRDDPSIARMINDHLSREAA